MDERELLALLADDAPEPGPRLADDVVRRGRAVRARRRLTVAGAVAATVLAAVTLPYALRDDPRPPPVTAAASPSGSPTELSYRKDSTERSAAKSSGALNDLQKPADLPVEAYAVAIEGLLQREHVQGPIYVVGQVCPSNANCSSPRLSGEILDALPAALPGRDVRYTPPAGPPEPAPAADQLAAPATLRLGRPSVTGDVVALPLALDHGRRNTVGLTYLLRFVGDRWTIVGTKNGWIS